MATLKSYKCLEHGYFDAWSDDNACPVAGCAAEVGQVLVKACSIRTSNRTKKIDATQQKLASDFKMTNIKSTREGEHQSGYLTRNNSEPKPGDSVLWGNQGGFDINSLVKGGYARPVRDESVGFSPSEAKLPGLKPSVITPDHENLTIRPGDT